MGCAVARDIRRLREDSSAGLQAAGKENLLLRLKVEELAHTLARQEAKMDLVLERCSGGALHQRAGPGPGERSSSASNAEGVGAASAWKGPAVEQLLSDMVSGKKAVVSGGQEVLLRSKGGAAAGGGEAALNTAFGLIGQSALSACQRGGSRKIFVGGRPVSLGV